MKRAEYVHTGFGRWKWIDKEYCDRCGREVIVPWEAHRENGHKLFASAPSQDGTAEFEGYECLDSGCYTAVYNGQPKVQHFVGALTPTHTSSAAALNEGAVR
jgi:hypothetical protein